MLNKLNNQKTILKGFLLLILVSIQSVYAENSSEIGLITGSKTGTYIQIGRDIAELAETKDIPFKVYESKGSLENIAAVFEREDVQLGLVQSDVLGYLQETQNRKLERVAQQVVMMFPLYNEEVHLLAKKNINSIYDLANKHVAVGNKGSGTNLTSELLFELTNVWPEKKYLTDDATALEWLQEGKVDGLFYVSGYPVKLLKDINPEEFHLVNLNSDDVSGYYIKSIIPEGTYRWQEEAIETIAVKAVLMTAGFYEDRCSSIVRLMSLIRNNVDWLKNFGHSKWKEIDLDFSLNNWDRYGCSKDSFGSHTIKE